MKIFIALLITFSFSNHNNIFSQKDECNWFYKLEDNGFDEVTRTVSSVGDAIYSPYINIIGWPTDPKYKGIYGMTLSWPLGGQPQLVGADQDKVQMSIKVNGVNKKYSFTTKYSKGPSLAIVGGANKDFLNDLKNGTELNIVVNLNEFYKSQVYRYELKCSSSCITKLMAP